MPYQQFPMYQQPMGDRGVERMDVTEMGRLTDMVRDLSEAEKACWEAEYYRAVTESMGASGYSDGRMGYDGDGDGRMGYRDSRGRYATRPRRGYDGQEAHGYEPGQRARDGQMGYSVDPMQGVREALSSASPEQRDRMMREMRTMVGM